MITEDSKDFIRSIARCMDVIKAFDAENVEMSPADVATRTNLTRATARRILLTLAALGYVVSDGKWFRLAPRILDLGYSYLSAMQVSQVIQPIINKAGKKAGETCVMSVMDGLDVISIAHSLIDRYDRVSFYPGTHMPAFVSAAGRVTLANQTEEYVDAYFAEVKMKCFTPSTITTKAVLKKELDHVRQQGYASVDGELEQGLYTVAVPIYTDTKIPVAAVSFGGNVARINDSNIEKKYLPELFKVAERIGRLLPNNHSFF